MAPACPWVRQRRYERLVLAKTVVGVLGSSWGKSKITIRELSLGGGMGTKEDNLRIGSEADMEISVGMRTKIHAHVLLRRARVNEVGFEIVSTDLESRYKLRRLLVEALNHAPRTRGRNGVGRGKCSCKVARFKSCKVARFQRQVLPKSVHECWRLSFQSIVSSEKQVPHRRFAAIRNDKEFGW